MSKPTATLLPGALLLLDFWPLRRLGRRAVVEKLPFCAVSLASAVITVVSQGRTAAVGLPTAGSGLPILLGFCHNMVFYPSKMIWPVDLMPLYTTPEPMSLVNPLVMGTVIGAVVLAAALLISLRWTRALLTGWLIFLCIIFPTIGGIGFTVVIASDKYAYLPAVGLLLSGAWAMSRLWTAIGEGAYPSLRRAVVALAVLLVLIAEAVGTRRCLAHWQTTERLYEHILALAPHAAVAHNDLALEWVRQGRYDEAVAGYRKALALAPQDPVVHNNLCDVLVRTGQFGEAREECLEAIRLRPSYAEAYNNLGAACIGLGETEAAVEAIDNALRHKPEYAEAYANLAHVREGRGQLEEAADHYRRAFQLKPDRAFLVALGDVLARKGDADGALAAYTRASGGSSSTSEVHHRLANVLSAAGNRPLAEEHYREALRLSPDFVVGRHDYGIALAQWGRRMEAIVQFRRVVELEATNVMARYNLGLALAEEGRFDEAVEALAAVRQMRPGDPRVEYTLGVVFVRQGRPDEAAACFRRAIQADPQYGPAGAALAGLTSQPASQPDRRGGKPGD